MYLRTTKRRNRDGSVVVYYQLAHNVRHPESGNSVAQVLHSFGRADQVNRDDLVRLCRSIARVCGLEVRDPLAEGREPPCEGGLPEGIRYLGSRSFGVPYVVEALWERFAIGPVLRRIQKTVGSDVPYERALLAMTANRMCAPGSKLGTWERWLPKVYLPSCEGLKLRWLYEAMDLLQTHAEEVEQAVFLETADLFNLEVDLIFYDTTTCAFAIDEPDDEGDVRQFGHSKEGVWSPQIVVALAVTRAGLPVRSWVFPGNTTDVKTIERVRQDLRGWKLGRALFVSDSGMNSEDNRRELARACGRYVMAVRAGAVKEVKEHVLSKRGRYRVIAENLKVKEVVVGEGERRRRYVLCYNPREAERQERHRKQLLAQLKAKIASHKSQKATAKWAAELRASKRFGRYVKVDAAGTLRIDRDAVKAARRMDGKWVLLTNDDTLSMEDAATSYKSLLVIERCFRTLKRTRIRMSPVHHWLFRRIEAHVKICVLALLLERAAELLCDQTWPRIAHVLDGITAGYYRAHSHSFIESAEPTAQARNLLKKLKIKPPKRVLKLQSLSSDE